MTILPTTRVDAALVATPDDPRCVAIANRYGEINQLFMAVNKQQPKADTPSLVMVMKTYGPDEVKRQLEMRIRFFVLKMDDGLLNDEEVSSLADSIANNKNARILGYDLVLDFFRALEEGEYPLYACKPRHIMEAWQTYAKSALAIQHKLKEQAEREQRDREWEEHHKQCITLAEFKRRQQANQ